MQAKDGSLRQATISVKTKLKAMNYKTRLKIRKATNEALRQECQKWRLEEIVAAKRFYELEPKNKQAADFATILGQRMFEYLRDGK